MKKNILKLLIILFIPLCILGCKNNNEVVDENNKDVEIKEDIEEKVEYIDNNPIILGLYKNYRNGSKRKLIKEFDGAWKYHTDISSFEVYYTNEEEIPNTNQIKLFDEYLNNYENINDYRIGYIISFQTVDGNIEKTIISPKDTESFFNYLEIYLYDDYHRTGGWYSHTTESEWNSDTLLTSIKLTAGIDVDKIISNIKVVAFTYDNDDFDENGNYIGKSKYEITVIKKQ